MSLLLVFGMAALLVAALALRVSLKFASSVLDKQAEAAERARVTKIIKAEKAEKAESDYTAALVELESLIARDPLSGTPDAERLELLALLVQSYKDRKSPVRLPNPEARVSRRPHAREWKR